MPKSILKIIFVFILGIGGGIFADQILWPYFIERPFFYEYRLDNTPIYITENKEIFIQENTALQSAIEKVEKTVIAINFKTAAGKIIEGSGFIVSSDGLAVVLAELVPQNENTVFFIGNKFPSYQVIKRDQKENLVLIKFDETGLPTAGFADSEKLKAGQRIFLIGNVLEKGILKKTVNEGIIKNISEKSINTNIFEDLNLKGSPLFDIEGRLAGIITINSKNEVSAIPINKIREFAGL